jgi:hypothetical protein
VARQAGLVPNVRERDAGLKTRHPPPVSSSSLYQFLLLLLPPPLLFSLQSPGSCEGVDNASGGAIDMADKVTALAHRPFLPGLLRGCVCARGFFVCSEFLFSRNVHVVCRLNLQVIFGSSSSLICVFLQY